VSPSALCGSGSHPEDWGWAHGATTIGGDARQCKYAPLMLKVLGGALGTHLGVCWTLPLLRVYCCSRQSGLSGEATCCSSRGIFGLCAVGRKKIRIEKITDERNRQVSRPLSSLVFCSNCFSVGVGCRWGSIFTHGLPAPSHSSAPIIISCVLPAIRRGWGRCCDRDESQVVRD
jgi:hypothetical protein